MEYRLYIGRRYSGISVRPDSVYANMWRIRRADGTVSDMVNLTRAKDAAVSWARPRGLGSTEIVQWK